MALSEIYIEPTGASPSSVSINHSRGLAAISFYNGKIVILNLATKKTETVLVTDFEDMPARIVTDACFSPDGNRFAACVTSAPKTELDHTKFRRHVMIWNTEPVAESWNKPETVFTDDSFPKRVAFSPCSQILAVGGRNSVVLRGARSQWNIVNSFPYGCNCLSFSADGGKIVIGANGARYPLVCDLQSGEITPVGRGSERENITAIFAGLSAALFCGNDRFVMTTSNSGHCELFEIAGKESAKPYLIGKTGELAINDLDVSGNLLVYGSTEGRVTCKRIDSLLHTPKFTDMRLAVRMMTVERVAISRSPECIVVAERFGRVYTMPIPQNQ